MRSTNIRRQTKETTVELTLSLDGSGTATSDTGIGFFDHMLEQVAKHGGFDLTVTAVGDLVVDSHHTVEDVGICLGMALAELTADMTGLARYGQVLSPMDDALTMVVVDLSKRSYLHLDVDFSQPSLGDFDLELCEEFFLAVARCAQLTLHIVNHYGGNNHHKIESVFKGFGRALGQAVRQTGSGTLLTTKGKL